MQAMQNITILNGYDVKKIVTGCPHCFNTIKNEYPELGGKYEVIHHTELVQQLINEGKLKVQGGEFKGKKIVFHDPCYLGRANSIYEAPRDLILKLDAELVEMKRCKQNGRSRGGRVRHALRCAPGRAARAGLRRAEDVPPLPRLPPRARR